MKLLLVSQLLDQTVALLGHLVALLLLGVQRGLGFAQLLLQGGVGSCKHKKRKENKTVKVCLFVCNQERD